VANITLSTTPQLITRQRRNLGRAKARGLETELEVRPHRMWTVNASYLLSNSKVSSFPSQPDLVGLRLPQVPKHQFSLSTFGTIATHYRIHLQARGSGDQFENDINTLILEDYMAMDAYMSRSLGPMLEFFVAGENIANEQIQVGRAGVTTLGMPRTFRTGVNFRFGAR
jgi:outer membrane receptor protein involved in Fe transport